MIRAAVLLNTFAPTVVACLMLSPAEAQPRTQVFAGAVGGVSTLSADARAEITSGSADTSLYKPENGGAVNALFGVRLHDYLAVQASYVWNANDVTLSSVHATGDALSAFRQPLTASQHAFVADALVYFRELRSAIRPYLSAGVGVVRVTTKTAPGAFVGETSTPKVTSRTTGALLRVAVGIDLSLTGGWSARYSFSESLSANPIGAQLSPPGERKLANFQNLVGLVRAF